LGAFISVDPLVAKTGTPYLYANGNPTALSDPGGDVAVPTCNMVDGEACITSHVFDVFLSYETDENGAVVGVTAHSQWATLMGYPHEYRIDCTDSFSCGVAPPSQGYPILEDAPRLWSDILSGFDEGADGGGGGLCAGGSATAGVGVASATVSMQGCAIADTDGVSTTLTVGTGVGVGASSVSFNAGVLITNADAVGLSYWSMCGAATGGALTGSLCGAIYFDSASEQWEYSGAWSMFVGASTPSGDFHSTYAYTWVDQQFSWPSTDDMLDVAVGWLWA